MAMRANDKLGRHLLAGSHPIAAALALLDASTPTSAKHSAALEGGRDDVVGRALRDLAFPRALAAMDDESAAIERDFRGLLLANATERARAAGVDVAAAFAAPAPSARAHDSDGSDGHGAWCPRCRAVYRAVGGASRDCGVPLVPFVPLVALTAAVAAGAGVP